MKAEAGAEARALLLQSSQGILSTHSQEMPGYPFGSVAPFCLDAAGRPVILISELAQHTKNLRADPRCSLIVVGPGEDLQATARLTLIGECRPVAEEADIEAAAVRYYRYFPDSTDFHRVHDFRLFVLEPVRCRYIGGFGRIHWADPADVLLPNPFAGEAEGAILTHMNEDHQDALAHYCRQAGMAPEGMALSMVGIDAEGAHLRLGGTLLRIPFPAPIATPAEARQTLVALARAGR